MLGSQRLNLCHSKYGNVLAQDSGTWTPSTDMVQTSHHCENNFVSQDSQIINGGAGTGAGTTIRKHQLMGGSVTDNSRVVNVGVSGRDFQCLGQRS